LNIHARPSSIIFLRSTCGHDWASLYKRTHCIDRHQLRTPPPTPNPVPTEISTPPPRAMLDECSHPNCMTAEGASMNMMASASRSWDESEGAISGQGTSLQTAFALCEEDVVTCMMLQTPCFMVFDRASSSNLPSYRNVSTSQCMQYHHGWTRMSGCILSGFVTSEHIYQISFRRRLSANVRHRHSPHLVTSWIVE
jgi:hypothetical protein